MRRGFHRLPLPPGCLIYLKLNPLDKGECRHPGTEANHSLGHGTRKRKQKARKTKHKQGRTKKKAVSQSISYPALAAPTTSLVFFYYYCSGFSRSVDRLSRKADTRAPEQTNQRFASSTLTISYYSTNSIIITPHPSLTAGSLERHVHPTRPVQGYSMPARCRLHSVDLHLLSPRDEFRSPRFGHCEANPTLYYRYFYYS